MPNETPNPQQIPIGKIHDLPGIPAADQPDKAYGSLVSSILVGGVKTPLILRQREDGEYQVVDGQRRRKASELAKLQTVPALVYEMTEQEAVDYRLNGRAAKAPVPGKLAEAKGEPSKAPANKDKADAPSKKPEAESPKPEKAAGEKKTPAESKGGKKTAATTKEEAPSGAAADGPTGTVITKVLESHLTPPTDKEKRSLPIPGQGEAFSVVLHPAYLKKADINTFSVDRDTDDFKELFKSIERFGVNAPIQARVGKEGELEIISGQRRHLIASELNYPVPTIIQQMDDDDARILVADGNLHREHISTYDLSRAVKMKSEAMKRKAGRRNKSETGPRKIYTDAAIAMEMGMSESKLNRLMKLSEATRRVCDLVDENKLPLSVAYNIAFLSPDQQEIVVDLIDINIKVNNENTQTLKKIAEKEPLTEAKIRDILEGTYPPRPVEKPAPVPQAPAAPSMAPANIPASPDVQPTVTPAPAPSAPGRDNPAVAAHAPGGQSPAPVPPASAAPGVPPTAAAPPVTPSVEKKEPVDRENSYETKVVLRGDRLRKYFPDVRMTPREIEDSVYDALEERRQRQERAKAKAEILKGGKDPVK